MTNSACIICNNPSQYKIKGENIYYCEKHYKQFFTQDSLESIEKIKLGKKQAEILKKFLNQ